MASVLLLHKDKLVLELMGAVLRAQGHQVQTAQTREAGEAIAEKSSVDLAILEVGTSKDAWTALGRLRSRSCRRDMVILMIAPTAHADQVKAAAGLGARGFIVTNQFKLDHFLGQVERAMAKAA